MKYLVVKVEDKMYDKLKEEANGKPVNRYISNKIAGKDMYTRKKYNTKTNRKLIQELSRKGLKIREIAAKLNLSRSCVYNNL